MRTFVTLLALACIAASLLASSQALSIAFVIAAIVLATVAIGAYVAGEMRLSRPSRAHGPVDMRGFSRPIPVDHVEPARRTNG